MMNRLLELSHQNESNGNKIISLNSIKHSIICNKNLNILLFIKCKNPILLLFDLF